MSLLLRDVWLLDGSMDQGNRGDVLIQDGCIKAVDAPGTLEGNQVFDGRGRIAVLPALVNCHTHAAMVLLRGLGEERPLMEWLEQRIWPVEARLTPERIYWGARSALLEMASTGTVCFGDMYFEMDQVGQAARDAGMRCGLCRGIVGGDAHKITEGVELADVFKDDPDITVQMGPHAPYTVPMNALREITDLARNRGLSVHIHFLEAQWELGYLRDELGCEPLEYLERSGLLDTPGLILAHGVWIPDDILNFLVNYGVTVVHNPGSNLKLGSGVAPVPGWIDAGVSVALGTDGAASNNRLDMWNEMRSMALIHKGVNQDPTTVTAAQVLEAATYGGYRALGFPRSGRIRPGWDADLMIVDLDRPQYVGLDGDNLGMYLVYAGSSADVKGTLSRGRWIYRDGTFPGQDVEDVLRNARQARTDLTEAKE
ncbi:MAG: amidohydrolase [Dethiosulfovibrio peptidovorans]|nr:MAG: amidohydrolase [Dethiosulfovibrio peptidovorans]